MTNIGISERIVRALGGLLIIATAIQFRSWWGLAGALMLFTALLGWCGFYQFFGVNTCKVKK